MDSPSRFSPYATPSATREVLERHGLYTKYALGQNFLVNDAVVGKIVDLADLCEDDFVLEVGPGIGTLTAALLKRCGCVMSVEKDGDLPNVLGDTLSDWLDSFSLLQMDALDLTSNDLDQARVAAGWDDAAAFPNKLVSNLPYAVAATVVLDYLQRFDFLDSATVMVQKEVADRMTARPGSKTYGAYTVKLSMYARHVSHFPVSPGSFFPPPRVESTVIRLDRACAHDHRFVVRAARFCAGARCGAIVPVVRYVAHRGAARVRCACAVRRPQRHRGPAWQDRRVGSAARARRTRLHIAPHDARVQHRRARNGRRVEHERREDV